MTNDVPPAPPVVAVVVVHAPGPWFDETLASLASQDYPNLDTLFLLAGGPTDAVGNMLDDRILQHLPRAFVRDLGANPGFGAAANDVLALVEGDSGFFCICHDDVALDPDAIRRLVEELYRSNAGVVGPKLVSWDDPAVLQHVGLGLDRFGEIDPITEPGEYDQEQHDAVSDVFVLPSACLLVRADLFRALGGFDPAISFHGDDVDLCWRVHLSGARVVVAPQARVRHREELEARRPELNHHALRARHRMRSVVTLTGGTRLPVRSLEMAALTLVELVVGVFTARIGEAWSSLRAFVGLVPRTPALLARRGAVAKIRRVGDDEIIRLQNRGSARLTSYRRARDTETFIGLDANVRRWRESSIGATVAWIVVVVGVLVASRTLIDTRVPNVGEFLPLPDSPLDWWRDYVAGWNPGGLGATVANPAGWAALSIGSVLWLFRMGLGLTVLVVGLVFLGALGTWRLATLYPATRARVVALIVYAAIPLAPGIISTGRLSALVAYAAVPWFVNLLRIAVGIGTADPNTAAEDMVDGIIALSWRERLRRTALLAIATALAVAMAPALLPVLGVVAVVLGVSTLAVGAGWRTAGWMTGLGLAACAVAWLLVLPWSTTWSWEDLVAPELAGPPGRGLVDVATMAIGQASLEVLAVALYVPMVVALATARAWRLTWAARGAGLVLVFLTLAVLQDRDRLPFRLPEVGVLLAPVALGLALSAASAVAAFSKDVAGRTFGWRQPAGVLSLLAVGVGVFPAVLTITDGAWFAPRNGLLDFVQPALPSADEVGDYRVLYLGDPRLIPFPSEDLGDGVAMALVGDGPADLRDRWPVPDQDADAAVRDAIGQIRESTTLRGGRLLAPYSIRYIVVPFVDGANSTAGDPLPVPAGLLDLLGAQLDLVPAPRVPTFARFDNRAAIPTTAVAGGALAEASTADSPDALVGVDTSTGTPTMIGVDETRLATAELPAGSLLRATPLDESWDLEVAGSAVAGRPAFGVASAYDVTAAGPAELRYRNPASRTAWLVVQALLWVAVLVAASRFTVPQRLRTRRVRDETLIDLDAAAPADRTGFSWVDELFAEEDEGSDRPGRAP